MKSLKFVNDDLMDRLKRINLIKTYLGLKEKEIQKEKESIENPDEIINGTQLTNIGVFRKYVQNYLNNSDKIDQKEIILVRQLQSTPEGLPLEIYCFATEADTEKYENIQSDIFDHLLSAAKEFELDIVQKA
jgi:miniconductance mechanosensitive channel